MRCYKKKIQFSLLLAVGLIALALLCTLVSKIDFSDDSSIFSSESISGRSTSDSAFEAYMEDLFRQEVSASALTLHYTLEDPSSCSITQYSTELGLYSAENFRISAALAENISAALTEYDIGSLSPKNQLTLEILKDSLYNTTASASFLYYEEPLRPGTGDQAELPVLLAEYTFSDIRDINDYLEILSSIPAYFDSICVYEREKKDRGLFMADFAAETVIAQCSDFAASADSNYLIYTFDEKIDSLTGLSQNEKAAYKEQNRAILISQVLPAYQSLADTLTELYSPVSQQSASSSSESGTGAPQTENTGNQAGLCRLPLGTEYYEYLVKSFTGSGDSVETLQKRTEGKRAADLTEAACLLADHPELPEEMAAAEQTSDGILAGTPEEMLEYLKNVIQDDFPAIEDCSCTVKYVDEAMEDYMAPAFYLTAPLDHFTENSIYINGGSGYEGLRLFTTLAHEGYPGHLYQNAAFCSTSPSPMRALLGPAGYTEGWATYVEMRSYYYAGLSDDLAEVLSLEQSAILSLYASADMGIHYDGWSFEQTWDFFSEYGFSDESSIREIFELIAEEPAHYLKYYIGYLEFLSLKDYAEETMGEAYSDLEFHRTVLEMGPASFPLLKKYFTEFYSS